MDALPRPEVILTHESDLDGFVAGHLLRRLARHLFQEEVRLEAWNTQAWRQRPLRERCAWVCDFAFEARLDRPDWLVIDHHPTEDTPKSARLIHDPAKSATRLCHELAVGHGLTHPAVDRLVELTDIGDLFQEGHPDFALAQEYASLLPTYQFWNLSRLIDGELERLIDHPLLEVVRTRRRVEDPLGLAWSRSRIFEISPEVGGVEVVVGSSNLIVHALLSSPECRFPVLATLGRKTSSGIAVSLRSRGGEAQRVARALQGGGHPNAAGATLPRSIQGFADAVEYLKRVLNPKPVSLPRQGEGPLGGLSLD